MPIDELFIARGVKPEIPVKAKIFTSVQCASCGEMVAEHRARVRNGTFVCIYPVPESMAEGGDCKKY
jgi:formylmethanofuran dehydrogenase subunit E